MRAAWRGPQVELVDRADRPDHGGERRADAAAAPRPRRRARRRRLHPVASRPGALLLRTPLRRPRRDDAIQRRAGRCPRRRRSRGSCSPCLSAARQLRAAARGARAGRDVSDTLVFIPGVERGGEPSGGARRLSTRHCRTSTCSWSTTARPTGPPRWRASTAREVLSLGANRGLRVGIAAGLPVGARPRLRVLRPRRRRRPAPGRGARPAPGARPRRRCDVAVGSRFVSGDGYRRVPVQPERAAAVRHRGPPPRRWRSCCRGRSATRPAASTRSTRRRCRSSPSRSRAERPRSRR